MPVKHHPSNRAYESHELRAGDTFMRRSECVVNLCWTFMGIMGQIQLCRGCRSLSWIHFAYIILSISMVTFGYGGKISRLFLNVFFIHKEGWHPQQIVTPPPPKRYIII